MKTSKTVRKRKNNWEIILRGYLDSFVSPLRYLFFSVRRQKNPILFRDNVSVSPFIEDELKSRYYINIQVQITKTIQCNSADLSEQISLWDTVIS